MRTEQDVLNDFEKLGYKVVCNSENELVLEERFSYWVDRLHIIKTIKKYAKKQWFSNKESFVQGVDIQEHKLLNELFQIWGWF